MASKPWSFLSSHGLVFVHIIRHPESTNRKIAQAVGLTERTVHRILRDLETEKFLVKTHIGRRTSYQVNPEVKLRHPLLQDVHSEEFLSILTRKVDRSTGK